MESGGGNAAMLPSKTGDAEHSEEKDIRELQSLRAKVSKIKNGHASGTTWGLKDLRRVEELRRGTRKINTLDRNIFEINEIVWCSWHLARQALLKLYENPWKRDPIDFIQDLILSLDRLSP